VLKGFTLTRFTKLHAPFRDNADDVR